VGTLGHYSYLEVLTYKVSAGRREDFHAALQAALGAMERAGLCIVGFGPSAHDADSYFLLRAYPSLESRSHSLDRCYCGQEWLKDYDPALAPLVQSCSTVVLPCEPEGIEKLKHTIFY